MIHVDSTTNPYIISNFHLLCKAGSCTSLFCIKCMSRCINTYPRTKQNIISNLDSARIKHYTIKVCIEMISYLDIITKLTSERRLKKYILPHLSKNLTQKRLTHFRRLSIRSIILVCQLYRYPSCLNQFRCKIIIHKT